ncbi:MAG TPA: hypothetical protein VKJ47_05155, partial [Candidatus Binatia bacterium]|nr:hypothetical protein [Candidatus Binatia bacterium]
QQPAVKAGGKDTTMRSPSQFGGDVKYRRPPLTDLLPDCTRVSRSESHAPCWRCGGKDRFVVWLSSGLGWCRQCGWKGDSLQLLQDRDGITFREAKRQLGLDCAPPSRQARALATARRDALAQATQDYRDWQRRQLVALTDEFRDVADDIEAAEIAHRALRRVPALYSDDERRYWARRLGALYDKRAALEYRLDLLTYEKHQAARLSWWQEEATAL